MTSITFNLIIKVLVFPSCLFFVKTEGFTRAAGIAEASVTNILMLQTPQDSIAPRPPMPPIERKSLIKATRLAADYARNRSRADKVYKQNHSITIEGMVKEIRAIDYKTCTIILSGGPCNVDLYFEDISPRKAAEIKKGTKATFLARCETFDGNVHFSACVYLKNPTYY